MQCLTQNVDGTFSIMATQPDVINSCIYVLTSGDMVSIFKPLTVAQGSQIAVAIGICWATAAAFRAVAFYLKSDKEE